MQIKMDKAAVREIEATLSHIKNGSNRAMASAINHTLGVTRTEASSEIRKDVKLKAAYVRERLQLRKASLTRPEGRIATPTRGILGTRFPHREYARGGMGVQIKPTGGYKRMPGAWLMVLPNGQQAIVFRPSDPSEANWKKAGLRVVYGPSVSQVFTDVKDDLQAPSGERLIGRMKYEAERLIARQ